MKSIFPGSDLANPLYVLGIETSCDETAVAIVSSNREVVAHKVLSQLEVHQPFGGVVPEIAARAHMEYLDVLVKEVLSEGKRSLNEIDAIAVTAGPGLIGGVMVGVMMAKGLAFVAKKPLIGVNHLEGHALTVRLTHNTAFPYLLLLVSGGHCQILVVEGLGRYHKLGATCDDALGEAYDKVAKMLGLGYPGGPIVEQYAKEGSPTRFAFPRALKGRPGCDFSFSGLKTAVKREVDQLGEKRTKQDDADICASFQAAACDILKDRLIHALDYCLEHFPAVRTCVVAGGVAANQCVRHVLSDVAHRYHMELVAPPLALCTDNAAMIGWVGVERLVEKKFDTLSMVPRARWPLTEMAS